MIKQKKLSLLERARQVLSFIRFKFNYWGVPIIKPLKIGTYYSQVGQDFYLGSLLFKLIENGKARTIIDIGCNHPIKFSNSYFFEKYFGCNTIAIDPIKEYENIWNSTRPNATFINCAIGDTNAMLTLHIPKSNGRHDDMFASLNSQNRHLVNETVIERTVSCTSLRALFKERDIHEVLFVSIDVEGFEMQVLKGIDFDSIKIYCFLIENNSNELYGSDNIRKFLQSKGFVFISRIACFDDVFIHSSLIGSVI